MNRGNTNRRKINFILRLLRADLISYAANGDHTKNDTHSSQISNCNTVKANGCGYQVTQLGHIQFRLSQVRQNMKVRVIFNKPGCSLSNSLTKSTPFRKYTRFSLPKAKTPNSEESANRKLPWEAPSGIPQFPIHHWTMICILIENEQQLCIGLGNLLRTHSLISRVLTLDSKQLLSGSRISMLLTFLGTNNLTQGPNYTIRISMKQENIKRMTY